MPLIVQADPAPLLEDTSGALRVGQSRVLFELVIAAFEEGATPETIVQRYETLSLADIYAVIAYYLRHRQEIDEYLQRRERQVGEVRQRITAAQGDLGDIRGRLLARQTTLGPGHADAGH